jgi:hypothetical protein
MGIDLQCSFNEGMDAIVMNVRSKLFGNVGRVLDYTGDSCVLIQFHGDKGSVSVSFLEAVPLNMGGSYNSCNGDIPRITAAYSSLVVGMMG